MIKIPFLNYGTLDFYDLADAPTRVNYAASGQTGSGNGRTDYSYSYIGRPLRTSTTRDEAGAVVRTVIQTYGNEGELVAQGGDLNGQRIAYDALYRMVAFQDGYGSVTNYYYDGNGRATATVYPGADFNTGANMERTTMFDNSGLPLQTVDGRGVVSNIGYTPDGLPESVSYPASPAENVSLTYNSFGQPTGRADASGEETYSYNNRGLMITQSTRYRNAAGALMNPFVQTQHFYASGALQQLASSVGNQDYGYDSTGRLTGLQDPDGALTSWTYDARDQLQSQTLSTQIAGNITTTITRNVLGQLTSQRHASGNNTTLSSWGHATNNAQKQLYNALGQLARSTASTTPSYPWGGTTTYAYDNRTQLASESSTRGAGYSDSFGYNNAANPVSWKGQTRSFNSNNQETTGNAFLYDGAGNTTQMPNNNLAAPGAPAPTHKLVYNAQGQLAELRDSNNVVIATYVYRGDGKRAWKELANGQRSYFYYAGEMLIASTNGVDISSLQLWGADGLVGTRTTNAGVTTKSYNLYDTQGNLAQTINARNGVVLGKSAVSAWGEPIRDANGNAAGAGYGAKFGYVRDGESGFYLCTLRYYDASGGRWLTRDPIGYAGGSNLYGYVGNDPANATDPSGLARVEVHFREISEGAAGKAIQGIFGGKKPLFYHAYIQVWEKGGKSSYIVRAGPSDRGPKLFGYIFADVYRWNNNPKKNPELGDIHHPHVLVVASDPTKPASFYLDKMRCYAAQVNRNNIPYFPTEPNSNTFVSNILERTGLLPNAKSLATGSVPGW